MEKHGSHVQHMHGYGIYILVWFGLLILTGVTVAVAGINFGALTVATALIVATVKTYLVLTIFMHLKIEQRVFRVFVSVAIFFFVISIILLFADYSFLIR
jgi:cytochrome c oxidase subunit 4